MSESGRGVATGSSRRPLTRARWRVRVKVRVSVRVGVRVRFVLGLGLVLGSEQGLGLKYGLVRVGVWVRVVRTLG